MPLLRCVATLGVLLTIAGCSPSSGNPKVPAGANPSEEKQMLLAIANRPADNNTTYVTGGDVSRFQRRSIPAKTAAAPSAAAGSTNAPASGVSVPAGPVVRVARGNNVTVVPVGAR